MINAFLGNLPPPTNLRLIEAKSGELTFNWTAPLQNCPSESLKHAIDSSDDCICPLTASSESNNTLTCNGTQCIIRVYSVIICTRDYYGQRIVKSSASSNILSVNLTGSYLQRVRYYCVIIIWCNCNSMQFLQL